VAFAHPGAQWCGVSGLIAEDGRVPSGLRFQFRPNSIHLIRLVVTGGQTGPATLQKTSPAPVPIRVNSWSSVVNPNRAFALIRGFKLFAVAGDGGDT